MRHFAAVEGPLLASFWSSIGVIVWLLVTIGGPAGAAAQTLGADRPFLQADLGLSILGEAGQREHLAQSVGKPQPDRDLDDRHEDITGGGDVRGTAPATDGRRGGKIREHVLL